jgi:hypothetical protein
MYQTVADQGQYLSQRYKQVPIDWDGKAFQVFDSYNDSVLDYIHSNDISSLAQLLNETAQALWGTADSILTMRNTVAETLLGVLDRVFGQVEKALGEIAADERNFPQEGVQGVATAGILTGIQAATEVAGNIAGALSVLAATTREVVILLNAEGHSKGRGVAESWLASTALQFPNTSSSGSAPANYGDWRRWHLNDD